MVSICPEKDVFNACTFFRTRGWAAVGECEFHHPLATAAIPQQGDLCLLTKGTTTKPLATDVNSSAAILVAVQQQQHDKLADEKKIRPQQPDSKLSKTAVSPITGFRAIRITGLLGL